MGNIKAAYADKFTDEEANLLHGVMAKKALFNAVGILLTTTDCTPEENAVLAKACQLIKANGEMSPEFEEKAKQYGMLPSDDVPKSDDTAASA